MYIVDQRDGELMVLDSVGGHAATHARLSSFLAGAQRSLELTTDGACPLCPDLPPLRALRVRKNDAPVLVERLADGTLQISGRAELIARYAEAFLFELDEDGAHHHAECALMDPNDSWDPRSIGVIIEVANELECSRPVP